MVFTPSAAERLAKKARRLYNLWKDALEKFCLPGLEFSRRLGGLSRGIALEGMGNNRPPCVRGIKHLTLETLEARRKRNSFLRALASWREHFLRVTLNRKWL